ncbi:MAG TPA: glycosyltransferase family 9 protein [Mucilaginibacter sp.]|jgi:ADP-heptose:LPS heptosyltransferase|nr:glycosyltransferase family 9 protein [Mucilaginibacter sp.]
MGNRNLFRLSRFILLKVPYLFRFLARFRSAQKRLLIIKADAIGDYILFRNFIEVIKNSEKFKGFRIDLLGNKLWEDIALTYDQKFVDNFIFLNLNDLYMAPLQTFKLGWRLFRSNYLTVLQPTYTRTLVGDGIAALTGSRDIIGFESDMEGILPRYKAKTDKFYQKPLLAGNDIHFEFDRAKFFFETVLNQKLAIKQPFLPIVKNTGNYVLIFPGAGIAKRSWEPARFLELSRRIIKNTTKQIILAGGPGEINTGELLMKELPPDRVTNTIGKTSLTELIVKIADAELVVSNETSAIHIAASVGVRSVCILGGGHFGRFAPYPRHIQNQPICLFEKMDCFNCNWQCIYQTPANEPFPCVANVDLENVWQTISGLLA